MDGKTGNEEFTSLVLLGKKRCGEEASSGEKVGYDKGG